jgi:hypothetical protein
MTLRALLLSFPLALSLAPLAGCGGDSLDADVEKFVGLADEVCACKDVPCAEKVKERWDKLENEMDEKYKGKKDLDKDKLKAAEDKVEAAEARAKECGQKLAAGGAGAPSDSK